MPDPHAARLNLDKTACPVTGHCEGLLLPLSPALPLVLIENFPAAKTNDLAKCALPPLDVIKMGSPNVYINDQHAARELDQMLHGGKIISGADSVCIGILGDGVVVKVKVPKSAGRGAESPEKREDGDDDDDDDKDEKQKNDSNNFACFLDLVEISCSHSGRKIVSPPVRTGAIQGVGFDGNTLEVACDLGGDEITVRGTFSKGPCGLHAASTFILRSTDGGSQATYSGASFTFSADSQGIAPDAKDLMFLSWSKVSPSIYEIVPQACAMQGYSSLLVKAYPKVEGSITAFLKFGSPGFESSPTSGFSQTERDISGGISGQITYKGKVAFGAGIKIGEDEKKALDLCQHLSDFSTKVLVWLERLGYGKASIIYPNLEFKYSVLLDENRSDSRVSLQRTLSFSGDPLLGLEGRFDLLDTFLTLASGGLWKIGRGVVEFARALMRFQQTIRRINGNKGGADFHIWMTLGSSAGGSIQHTYNSIEELNETSGRVYVAGTVAIEAQASFKLDVVVVISVGGSASASSELRVEVAASNAANVLDAVLGDLEISWSGIQLKFVGYLTVEGWIFDSTSEYNEEAELFPPYQIVRSHFQLWP